MSNTEFYRSNEWISIRYLVLKCSKGKCQACGASSKDGAVLQVDHIIPRYLRPDLELYRHNLQVLCRECNLGKSYTDRTDWRDTNGFKIDPSKATIKRKSCNHQPYWNNKIEPVTFKNGTNHFRMTCILCGARPNIKADLAERITGIGTD